MDRVVTRSQTKLGGFITRALSPDKPNINSIVYEALTSIDNKSLPTLNVKDLTQETDTKIPPISLRQRGYTEQIQNLNQLQINRKSDWNIRRLNKRKTFA